MSTAFFTGSKKRKWAYIAVIGSAISGLLALIYGYTEFNRKPVDLDNAHADIVVTSGEIIREFESNSVAADEKYRDQIVYVSGTIATVSQSDEALAVSFEEPGLSTTINCIVDEPLAGKTILAGSAVRVKGMYVGINPDDLLGNIIILNRCIIESSKSN